MNISFSGSNISPLLLQAYLETNYNVYGPVSLNLRIGVSNPALGILHQANRVDSSAFLTAVNPYSQNLNEAANTKRQVLLAAELKRLKLIFIDGMGQHPSGKWPGEPSFLVFGLDQAGAKILGENFEQNAIIWNGSDAVPRLILLR